MPAGIIQGTFGWDNSPVISGMREAEAVVTQGASSIQSKFVSIFKRSPHMRAERAISGALQSFASGDIAGGIQNITARMTGLGLVAGIAIGAGVEIFQKFREQILATREAHEALQNELIKTPVSSVTSLSSEGMEKALERRNRLVENLQGNMQHRAGSVALETAQSFVGSFGLTKFGTDIGKERLEQDKDINQALTERRTITQADANLAAKIVSIKQQERDGDEHGAKIAKIMLETQQAQAALKTKGLSSAAFRTADAAVRASAVMDLKDENKRFSLKESSLAIEEKMAALIHRGLTPADQRKVRTGLEIKSLDEQIAGETNPERRRILNLERLNKQNELRSMVPAPGAEGGPGEWGSIERRNAEVNNPNVWGSLGYSAANRGETPAGQAQNSDTQVVAAINETNKIIREAWK